MGRGQNPKSSPRSDDADVFPDTQSQILADAAAGNWNEFLAAYLRPCWREVAIHCRMHGFSDADAEDMLQELLARLVTPRTGGKPAQPPGAQNIPARFLAQRQTGIITAQFHTWLKAIIKNVVQEFGRSRRRRRSVSLDQIAPEELSILESSVTALLDRHWLKETLCRAARELNRESQSARTKGARRLFAVFVRTSLLRESPSDIARDYGVDRTTISDLVARSRARFVELACLATRIEDPSELRAQIERTPVVLLESLRAVAVEVNFPGVK